MTKTETVAADALKEITDLQTKSVQLIALIGEIHLRLRDLQKEQHRIEAEFDKDTIRYEELILGLREKYPNGEVDLKAGIVTFEVAD